MTLNKFKENIGWPRSSPSRIVTVKSSSGQCEHTDDHAQKKNLNNTSNNINKNTNNFVLGQKSLTIPGQQENSMQHIVKRQQKIRLVLAIFNLSIVTEEGIYWNNNNNEYKKKQTVMQG